MKQPFNKMSLNEIKEEVVNPLDIDTLPANYFSLLRGMEAENAALKAQVDRVRDTTALVNSILTNVQCFHSAHRTVASKIELSVEAAQNYILGGEGGK